MNKASDRPIDQLLLKHARDGVFIGISLALRDKAEIEAHDENGNTALMLAASGAHKDCVTALLENGANPLARNNDGKTALQMAEFKIIETHLDICKRSINDTFDGTNSAKAAREKADACRAVIAALKKYTIVAAEKNKNLSTPERKAIRPLRPIHFKK